MHKRHSLRFLVLALILAGTSLACGLSLGGAGTPAPSATVPIVPVNPPTATAASIQTVPACDLHQLKGQATWQGATGSLAGSIHLDNPLPAACRLSGVARVILSANNGQSLAVHVESQPTDVILTPGQSTQARFVWRNYCGPAYKDGLVINLALPDPTSQLSIPVLDPNGAPLTDIPRCDSPSDPSAFELDPFSLTPP